MSWIEHHKVSEDLASQAQTALSNGRQQEAQALYGRAAQAEDRALADLDPSKTRTLGISAVSTVSLYYKAAEFKRAEEVANRWLEFDSLPEFAKKQLRDLLEVIRSEEGPVQSEVPEPKFSNIRDALRALVDGGDFPLVEKIDLPSRTERRLPIPNVFGYGRLGDFLATVDSTGKGLWRHQSLALERAATGKNVVLSTGTASGKSLIFQAVSLRLVLEDPEARILVFYPLKALAADQMASWKQAIEAVGLTEDTIGMIHGGIRPDEKRIKIIEKARIVLMTPDVCHAWFMRQVSTPSIRRFLASLRLLVIDEAHVLEAVFGSNVAYLLRRLQVARFLIVQNRQMPPLQIIAASATIASPAAHLESLTGASFTMIDEKEDGSSTYERSLLHISVPDAAQGAVGGLLSSLLDDSKQGSFITFVDSRQGVERIADHLNDDEVRPYRSGYEERDRTDIERSLQRGQLRGVISTSALELGINIPHFSVGLNVGIPNSRKAFRQRVGRIGRSQPGVFAVLANPQAFRRHGSTFEDYWQGSVEPSHLYLENRFMQFMHARCLSDELDALGAKPTYTPANVAWPEGFERIYEFARPGGARPREFDPIAQVGGDEPHLNYPLRNIGEISFKLQGVQGSLDNEIGTISLSQAIREAYPDGIYLHLARRYRVLEWRNSAFERLVRLTRTKAPPITRPLVQTYVNAAVDEQGILDGRYKESKGGFLCECELQVTERVVGYSQGKMNRLYKNLRQENPRLTAKTRDFRTTGIVLRIDRPWIREKDLKVKIASALKDLVIREYSVSPQDINCVATNIALVRSGTRSAISDAIVIYDGTYGSLRLTEPIFTNLDDLIERFDRAIKLTNDERDAPLPQRVVTGLREWCRELSENTPPPAECNILPDGFIQVLMAGSKVARRDNKGVLRDIVIDSPEMFDPKAYGYDGDVKLFYQYHSDRSQPEKAIQKVPYDEVVTIGDEWSWVLWSPTTGEFKQESETDPQP